MDWCKKTYKNWTHERTESKAWRRIDVDKGTYMTISQLVMDDGGWDDPHARAGADRLMRQNMAMGGPWVKMHPQTKRLLYLKLNFEYREEFEESWGSYKKEWSSGELNKKENPKGSTDQTAGDSGAKPSGTQTKRKNPDDPEKPTPKKVKTTEEIMFEKEWQKAVKLRKSLMTTIAQGQELANQIQVSDKWGGGRRTMRTWASSMAS